MLRISKGKKFVKSFKRLSRSGRFDIDYLNGAVSVLAKGLSLPMSYRDHALSGNLAGRREFHLKGDLVVVYEIDKQDNTLRFVDIGNHANVLGM